jgi:hypothetical protein
MRYLEVRGSRPRRPRLIANVVVNVNAGTRKSSPKRILAWENERERAGQADPSGFSMSKGLARPVWRGDLSRTRRVRISYLLRCRVPLAL